PASRYADARIVSINRAPPEIGERALHAVALVLIRVDPGRSSTTEESAFSLAVRSRSRTRYAMFLSSIERNQIQSGSEGTSTSSLAHASRPHAFSGSPRACPHVGRPSTWSWSVSSEGASHEQLDTSRFSTPDRRSRVIGGVGARHIVV